MEEYDADELVAFIEEKEIAVKLSMMKNNIEKVSQCQRKKEASMGNHSQN